MGNLRKIEEISPIYLQKKIFFSGSSVIKEQLEEAKRMAFSQLFLQLFELYGFIVTIQTLDNSQKTADNSMSRVSGYLL